MNNFREYFKFFADLSDLFEARFMRPLWFRYPSRDSDDYDALALFLEGYAFARQGARPDFGHVAVHIVRGLKNRAQVLTDKDTPKMAWDMFRALLQDQGLNETNSPLCPLGTAYNRRRTGLSTTYGNSVFEFLARLEEYLPPNLVSFARYSIQMDKVRGVHNELCTINGIGPKIASLFLRDVATFYKVFPSKDRILLQPVDVWIQRISEYLLRHELSKEDTGEWILEQAVRSNTNPEAVNEGMWYFGSEIANSRYRMSKVLDDLRCAKALIDEHIEAIRQEQLAWEHKQQSDN